MSNDPSFPKDTAYALYVSQEHDCSYLSEQRARTLFLDPSAKVDASLYQLLIDRGFRRSGVFLYQPACPQCAACVSLRIPVVDFKPNRSQRRNWKMNHHRIAVQALPAEYSQEHFDLYAKYQAQRHADGAMTCNESDQYMKFLTSDWAETLFYEFRLDGTLLAVAATDLLPNGISCVYTFFDPERRAEGLGVFALLWQIQHARELGMQWVYPGFWIEGSSKMSYKSSYRPLEAWDGKSWKRFTENDSLII